MDLDLTLCRIHRDSFVIGSSLFEVKIHEAKELGEGPEITSIALAIFNNGK